ncbi:hypothetical protein H3T72_gp05 [Enterococcus phage vB_EfaP_Ef7.3]|uniref:Uncharacterized protein n=1 Tax=Enterococcus phage vB_EfaP_Ef7.3 TaxID=2546619 RepID=A0A4D6DT00_9CAUD|nr:hypothetical protein H3T72_gp05 [Enterococcus phage vB_EfaP_Ef7.3]QBZ69056.1 hypothetical protein [Enterococcus phage vB_EfaP_Ef7.3]
MTPYETQKRIEYLQNELNEYHYYDVHITGKHFDGHWEGYALNEEQAFINAYEEFPDSIMTAKKVKVVEYSNKPIEDLRDKQSFARFLGFTIGCGLIPIILAILLALGLA